MELIFLSIALAMDSVAISMANGARCMNIKALQIFKMSFLFGIFQAFMPVIGYFLGLAFVGFISYIDHYVAFAIFRYKNDKRESTD
nr:manganese efflux pump [Campylobacter fetus]